MPPLSLRKIIHIDMDAFYVSVELLSQKHLRNKPVIVGGSPEARGVVATANYEARKYGIHSAMSCRMAQKKCPEVIFLKPNMQRYREFSKHIFSIFLRFTDIIESLSLDEAWLDVSSCLIFSNSATRIATDIQRLIFQETGLTCSAGVSYNKFLAKIAGEVNKPNGLYTITPEKAPAFLLTLPVKKFPGVGKVTGKKLESLGIYNGEQLLKKPLPWLQNHFGKFGLSLYKRVRGEDLNPVTSIRERKSIGVENTFVKDLDWGYTLTYKVEEQIEALWRILQKRDLVGKTLTLKVKFHDFQSVTRSLSSPQPFLSQSEIHQIIVDRLLTSVAGSYPNKKIRLTGVSLSSLINFKNIKSYTLSLFDLPILN